MNPVRNFVLSRRKPEVLRGLSDGENGISNGVKKILLLSTIYCLLSTILLGCCYTTGSLLPSNIKTIYVKTFTNKIDITAEVSEISRYRIYAPFLEVDITKEIIDRFIYDGNLQVVEKENADLILRGELIDYNRQSLRYDVNDEVEEYRLSLVVDLSLYDSRKEENMWEEKGFIGDSTYFTSGSLAKSEDTALNEAIGDLARRIVERTVEGW